MHKYLLFAIVLGLFLPFIWRRDHTPAAVSAAAPGVPAVDREGGSFTFLSDDSVGGGREVAPAQNEAAAHRAVVALEPAGSATRTHVLRGRVVVEDEFGNWMSRESGTVDAWLQCLDESVVLDVREGRFEMECGLGELDPDYVTEGGLAPVEDLGILRIWYVRLGERCALPTLASFDIRASEETVIHCRWVRATRLSVVDRDTGRELGSVDIALDGSGDQPLAPRELERRLVVRGEPSPVFFTPTAEDLIQTLSTEWWVGGAGYAWERVVMDHRNGGQRTVELARSGDLQITLLGERPTNCQVTVAPRFGLDDGMTAGTLRPGRGLEPISLRADRLEPGSWSVIVVSGGDAQMAELVRDVVEIVEGERVSLELELPAVGPRGTAVPLAGTLEIPDPWWRAGALMLSVHFAGESPHAPATVPENGARLTEQNRVNAKRLAAVEGRPGLRRWEGGRRLPGTYRARLGFVDGGTLWAETFQLGPGGDEDVRLVVPPPAELRVVLVDEATGRALLRGVASLEEAGFTITYRGLDGHDVFTHPEGVLDAQTGTFITLVPTGNLELSVDSNEFTWTIELVEVKPGSTEVIVALQHLLRLELLFESDGGPVAVPEEWIWEIEITDLAGGWLDLGQDDVDGQRHRTVFLVPDVGTCRVRFPALNGYEPLEDLEIDLDPLLPTRRTVALTSK